MTFDLAMLHTSVVHIEPFSKLLEEFAPQLKVNHMVAPELLEDARHHGLTSQIRQQVDLKMREGADAGAAVVVCTCSTIGGAAETSGSGNGFVSMRIDRAMADEAVRQANKILIMAALESTLAPTCELLMDSASKQGRQPQVSTRLVDRAWDYFEAGQSEQYMQTIAADIESSWQEFDAVVLAQASMAGVPALCSQVEIPILASPRIGVRSAVMAVSTCS